MSSYHQKNHLTKTKSVRDKIVILPCPECGFVSMKRIKADCTLNDGTKVPGLKHYLCSTCGSKFYDNEAMERIESIRQRVNKKIDLPVLE